MGHYYNSLKRIDKDINYSGFDVTKAYVKNHKKSFLKNYWKLDAKSMVEVEFITSSDIGLSISTIYGQLRIFKKTYLINATRKDFVTRTPK